MDEDSNYDALIGKKGLDRIMTKNKNNFLTYKKKILDTYGRIFTKEHI